MKTYIEQHWGELDTEVMEILEKHPEWWEGIKKEDLLHTIFYDVVDEKGNLIGFFGNSHWNNGGLTECVLCCAYVKEEYRKQGIFKKMVRYTVDHNQLMQIITIGAMPNNTLAKTIYDKMFYYSHRDEDNNGYWYFIKRRKLRNA